MDDDNASTYECTYPGCTAHPEYGDLITRTSPQGGPFRGCCPQHLHLPDAEEDG